jgi:hypothetical protein
VSVTAVVPGPPKTVNLQDSYRSLAILFSFFEECVSLPGSSVTGEEKGSAYFQSDFKSLSSLRINATKSMPIT